MRKLGVGLLIIGLVAGVIYVHSGVRNRLFFPLIFMACLIGIVIQFAKRESRSRTQAAIIIVTIVIWSIYIVAVIYSLA